MENNLKHYYTITAEPWEESTSDAEPVHAKDLRDALEQLHLVQRPDKAGQLYEAAKAAGWTAWELLRLKEAWCAAMEVLEGIADQIDTLEEVRE